MIVPRRRFLREKGASAVLLAVQGSLPAGGGERDFDLILKGGNLLDGTGRPAVRSGVGIRSSRIAALDLSGPTVRAAEA